MWLFEELQGCLPEVVDLVDDSFPHMFLLDSVDVDFSLVCKVEENIDSTDGLSALLFVPEDEVKPLVKVLGDVV